MEKILSGISKYKKKIIYSNEFNSINRLLKSNKINTVCHSARCPNIGECFSKKKLTFMILGDVCTRNCKFCNVKTGRPDPVDKDEIKRINNIVKELELKYIVITSVTRDDLEDGGASHFINLVEELKNTISNIKIEILIPDFNNNRIYLDKIADADADVIAHNIETVEDVFSNVRPQADYKRSLEILKYLKKRTPDKIIKSGFMVGLGEDIHDIHNLLDQLLECGIDVVTAGQYFQPAHNNIKVMKMYSDEEFVSIKEYAKSIGFKYVSAGRFVRSSYYAEEVFKEL